MHKIFANFGGNQLVGSHVNVKTSRKCEVTDLKCSFETNSKKGLAIFAAMCTNVKRVLTHSKVQTKNQLLMGVLIITHLIFRAVQVRCYYRNCIICLDKLFCILYAILTSNLVYFVKRFVVKRILVV